DLFSEADGKMISTFVASGDTGAADCSPLPILSVDALCVSTHVTCVGGTEFNPVDFAYLWNAQDSSVTTAAPTCPGSPTKCYIREGAWNNASGATGGGVNPATTPSWQ